MGQTIMASSASTHVTTTPQQNARKRWRFGGGSRWCTPTSSSASFLSRKRRSFASSRRRRRHTSSSSSFVVFVRNEWDNDSTTLRTTATKNEDDVLDHTRTSTNAKTTTTGSFRSSLISMMSPIQLQDVARKQFEDRERRRAQQVRLQRVFSPSRCTSDSAFFSCLFFPQTPLKGGGVFVSHILILRGFVSSHTRRKTGCETFARAASNLRIERKCLSIKRRHTFLAPE